MTQFNDGADPAHPAGFFYGVKEELMPMPKAVDPKSAGVLVKLTQQQRAAVEKAAARESTSMSQVVRRAVVRDLKRRAKADA